MAVFINSVRMPEPGDTSLEKVHPRPRRPFRPKAPLSVLALIALVLVLQFLFLPQYIYQSDSPGAIKLSQHHLHKLEAGLQKCKEYNTPPVQYPVTRAGSRSNPRWNPETGQKQTIFLKNATLFDGENILRDAVDIVLKRGVIKSVTKSGSAIPEDPVFEEFDLEGQYITPGLVDMHSHHLAFAWPLLGATADTNEKGLKTGPLTPQVRIVDSMKAYDIATTIIASGGVTTSLILPGSVNIIGGEAAIVKNLLRSGENSEEVVEEILLEHGVPQNERRRYMKMACGENPRRLYFHTRMGNSWLFREHMERARELMVKQDEWCLTAQAVKEQGDVEVTRAFITSGPVNSATDYLEYESSIAILRGQVGVNIHCYETEDMEDMIKNSKEFGFRIQAFHHALDAWEVPEMIKASGENITIATFSDFGFYKKEAYEANLWAGKILAKHGVPVAYKSDHVQEETNAKYLLFQAATAHAFDLPEDLALQSVTSVPARSLQIDHRVGYVRSGYDADLVIWNSHPLTVGATALQVYIDGRGTLDPKVVEDSGAANAGKSNLKAPIIPTVVTAEKIAQFCAEAERPDSTLVVTGIQQSYLNEKYPSSTSPNATLVISKGRILCFSSLLDCAPHTDSSTTTINLENGHVLPGLTAFSVSLGLSEIPVEASSLDGSIGKSPSSLEADNVVYAKYGVHLEGRGFGRARIGGVTRAITAPLSDGFAGGVSVGIKASGNHTVFDGGIFKDDVALHFHVGQGAKADNLPTISSEIQKLRQILSDNKGKDNIYGQAANGSIPLAVHADNEYDIMQLINVKKDFNTTDLVLLGGSSAHLVANELASSNIPLILTHPRPAPDTFPKLNSLPGPPLSRHPATALTEAGVKYAIAITGESDCHIHNLLIEASWAAKFAGLTKGEAVGLVSWRVDEILGLSGDGGDEKDFVVYEGDPLEFGARVVLGVEGGDGRVGMCWPESN
ncbi:hypothetical protein BJ875DRAFT_452450 [Amylocarpus encephaloides]|uniref:Amidohydrolase-related domain-containing protein n=1 Tax=Amylocarpus encephaloides TaxID=45428 RepID=A0A9P7YQR8_9HELO|nr:hypothetical protein BJ875DRAFT_452450 [Amylocarpus encephaloides]